ncbi:MAG: ECF-type sigma factor [Planctomycetaceae bacterium]|jgi:RNA polymerase sigma factor (sigma-70 family)
MTVESPGSVTNWLKPLQAGDPAAAEFVWDRYFELVVQLARKQLLGVRDRSQDAEDIALSALNALCHAARRGQLSVTADRDDLWRLLVTCTANRSRNVRRDSRRLKRGGDLAVVRLPSAGVPQPAGTRPPTPAEAAQFADDMRALMDRLDQEDPTQRLRQVALWKLEGYTDQEIARRLRCSRKTVCVRLSLIRALWQTMLLT